MSDKQGRDHTVMEQYNFWRDFFDTYQSLADWIKALWLIVPPAFVLGFAALVMHAGRTRASEANMLIQLIYRDDNDRLHLIGEISRFSGAPKAGVRGHEQGRADATAME